MTEQKVLIVDDDSSVRKVLTKVILSNGIQPFTASSGEEAIALINNNTYDLIILDVMMGGMDGFEVVKSARSAQIDTPIIILSGRNEDYDTIYGLDIGADDYITKPFNPILLGAKVKAFIRRNKIKSENSNDFLYAKPFKLSLRTLKLFKEDAEIILSSKESLIMKLFMENIGRVFTKKQIYEHIWGDYMVDENLVMVYISHLRNKIEDDNKKPTYIKTVWGVGYKFMID